MYTNQACKKLSMGFYRPPNDARYLNYGARPAGIVIDTIVIHHTVVGYAESYRLLANADGLSPTVSAHYLINEDGRIDNLVDDVHMAWHAGKSRWKTHESLNKNSIGIELVNNSTDASCCFKLDHEECALAFDTVQCINIPFPELQIGALIDLIKCLKSEHTAIQNSNVVGHMDIAPNRKLDPGILFPWAKLHQYGIGIYSLKAHSAAPVADLHKFGDRGYDIRTLKHNLYTFGYGYIDRSTDVFDEQLAYAVRAFHFHYNQDINRRNWGTWDTADQAVLLDLLSMSGEAEK